MSTSTASSNRLSPELVAMVAVIAISSWHVGNYMATFDGWVMATIMGATLGFCNFLMAHNIFKPRSTSRFASFCGLIFFAVTSTYMQYTYFNADPDIGKTLVWNINWDALTLGVWAPAAEILLGWIYAAGLRESVQSRSTTSRIERIGNALTGRIERQLNEANLNGHRAKQPDLHAVGSQVNGVQAEMAYRMNGYAGSDRSSGAWVERNGGVQIVQTEQSPLSKDEALERIQQIYRTNPNASYADIAEKIGRSKGTVANYVRELKETQGDEFTT